MKYYWIWSIVWTLWALASGIDAGVKKALYLASVAFVNSFCMWWMCYMYYLREKR